MSITSRPSRSRRHGVAACVCGSALVLGAFFARPVAAAHFTTGSAPAALRGTHEIVLTGDGSVANPFQTRATVRFVPPACRQNAITVDAFYDGGDTWRARVYVNAVGRWKWSSHCPGDPLLDGKSGEFTAGNSALRGMLRKHATNPRAWMTDDGRWFVNLSDTAYRLFHGKDAPLWREFASESAGKGITCLRAAALGGWGGTPGAAVDDANTWVWNDPWAGGAKPDLRRYDLAKFRVTDERLAWLLDHLPDLQTQMILFSFKGYGGEGTGRHWAALPPQVRADTMRYIIARWAAMPNVFWLIVNDMHCGEKHPLNQAFVREVGMFFAAHDPWRHLISTGPNRHAGFPFTGPADLKWCSYIYIEDSNAVGADQIAKFKFDNIPLHVWMGEDYYEHDHGRYKDPRYFFRWQLWSWLLSGGSGNYCGRWGVIHPYSTTWRRDYRWIGIDKKTDYTGEQLVGLDSVPYLRKYLERRNVDLARFEPNDRRVADADGRAGRLRPKLMERGRAEFIVYHPNAAADGHAAVVDKTKTARLRIDLRDATGRFEVEWYRALDGAVESGRPVDGGAVVELTAPWPGQDVVVRLLAPE